MRLTRQLTFICPRKCPESHRIRSDAILHSDQVLQNEKETSLDACIELQDRAILLVPFDAPPGEQELC